VYLWSGLPLGCSEDHRATHCLCKLLRIRENLLLVHAAVIS
jgi:hypothetical protein